ncbi:hypothetical protein B0H19DRAFT_1158915 [Mycena capillaripes]|nr:hypothetical protein B0H19DRAFT_1158915 [Mycena capillaripes]
MNPCRRGPSFYSPLAPLHKNITLRHCIMNPEFYSEEMAMDTSDAAPYKVAVDLQNLNYRMSLADCSPALAWVIPYCWLFLTQGGGDWNDLEAAISRALSLDCPPAVEATNDHFPPATIDHPDTSIPERLPSLSELAGNFATPAKSSPRALPAYTIPPANIPPEVWLEESLRMRTHHSDRGHIEPQPGCKRRPGPYFGKHAILFEPQIGRRTAVPQHCNATAGSRLHIHKGGKIRPNVDAPQISVEEADNIRKLQLESDSACRRLENLQGHRKSTMRHSSTKGVDLRIWSASSTDSFSQSSSTSRHSAASSSSSSSSSSCSPWKTSEVQWIPELDLPDSDDDDAASYTSGSSNSSSSDGSSESTRPSSWASYSTSSSSARRLSPPPGRDDRLRRMQQHGILQQSRTPPGLISRFMSAIASLWSAF